MRDARRLPPADWIKANLLSTWGNAILTIISVAAIALLVWRALDWGLFSA